MPKKGALLITLIFSIVIFGLNDKVEAVTADDLAVEINSSGKIIKGTQFEPDRPVFRPAYQGDYKSLFQDVKGPRGTFTGFYNSNNHNGTSQYLQYIGRGDTLIVRNVGSYQGEKVALKMTFLFGNTSGEGGVGVLRDGSIYISTLTVDRTIAYELVYDTENYPVVKDIYLDLPIEYTLTGSTSFSSSYMTIGPNLKKSYLTLPDSWWSKVKRSYSLSDGTFKFESNFVDDYGVLMHSNSLITDNNERANIAIARARNITIGMYLFKSEQKAPYAPDYLPVEANGLGNSTKFEANYNITQSVSDTYAELFPESLKIVAEDTAGYFKKIDQKDFIFKDMDGNVITDLVTVKKVSDSKLEFSLSKASLQTLQLNQINVALTFSDLNVDKVMSNFDSENKVYNVPLTFYNVRTKDGVDKKSEETKVNATITPNIYGEPKPTEVFVGTSTKDLNPLDLIENGVTTIPGDTLKVNFVGSKEFTTVGISDVSIEIASTVTPSLTKQITVPITVKKGSPITSAFFEDQSWLINEINRQLAPKKIDINLYEKDLASITTIDLNSGVTYPTEHIPANIGKLTNLTFLRIANRELIGSLPTELGELSKLTSLSIYGNTFEGGIPDSIGKLTELSLISLDDNTLKGTIPPSIALLPKLNQIYLNKNQLSGQLPKFPMNMGRITIDDNQLTYNLATVPTFITSATAKGYSKTFISGLGLTGNARVVSTSTKIKPFDKSDSGYFNLKALQGKTSIELFDEHSYTIKDTADGKIYYTGKRDSQVTIPYKKGISYTVILDDAEKNPNNVFLIQGKVDEFKFEATPASLSIQSKLGVKAQPVVLNGNLAIFDNRENKNWKLSITPSKLVVGLRSLKGEYSYTNKNGVSNSIVTGKKYMIETGKSDSLNEVIPVSENWSTTRGLSYTAYQSNYTGEYKGSVNWTLEDTP